MGASFFARAALNRGGQHLQGRRAAAALVPFLLVLMALPSGPPTALLAATGAATGSEDILTGSVKPARRTAHELRVQVARKGSEGLELAARLEEKGGLITKPVQWVVRRAITGDAAFGEAVYAGEVATADMVLEPGDYAVEARYGPVRTFERVALLPGQRIGMVFVLDVGALRALTRLDRLPLPPEATIEHRLFALDGAEAGQLAGSSRQQGEIVRLGAGRYRLESRILPGNTRAEAMVQVRAGKVSVLELSHQAGLALVEVGRTADWRIEALAGGWSAKGRGPRSGVVLAPGRYRLLLSGRVQIFEVIAGEAVRLPGR